MEVEEVEIGREEEEAVRWRMEGEVGSLLPFSSPARPGLPLPACPMLLEGHVCLSPSSTVLSVLSTYI